MPFAPFLIACFLILTGGPVWSLNPISNSSEMQPIPAAPVKVSFTFPEPQLPSWGHQNIHQIECSGMQGCTNMSENVIHVSTAAELEIVLENATGGETILLAAGDYGALTLGRRGIKTSDFASTVTIQSEDPTNQAVFSSLRMDGAKNVAFADLEFKLTYAPDEKIGQMLGYVTDSHDITFTRTSFIGDNAVSDDPAEDGYPAGFGLRVRESSNIIIEDSEFSGLWKAVAFAKSQDVVLRNSDIHDFRSDGINVVDSQRVLIENNYVHDVRRSYDSGDHSDMFQMFSTTKDASVVSSDITLRDNIFDIGEGGWSQTIFMPNVPVSKYGGGEEFYYKNIVIENNIIINDHVSGIRIGETDGLIITNNTVLQRQDANALDGKSSVPPRIQVDDASRDVTITDNVTPHIAGYDGQADWTVTGNFNLESKDYEKNFTAPVTEGATALEILPGSALEHSGAGASMTGSIEDPSPADPVIEEGQLTPYDLERILGDSFDFGAATKVYDLDMIDLATAAASLRGASELVPGMTEGDMAIRLIDDGYFDMGRITGLEDSQQIGFRLDFTMEDTGGRRMLVSDLKRFQVEQVKDRLKFNVALEDGSMQRQFSDRLDDLRDGAGLAHELIVAVNGETDILRAYLNGNLVYESTEADLDLVGQGKQWGWDLGTQFTSNAETDLRIDAFQLFDGSMADSGDTLLT